MPDRVLKPEEEMKDDLSREYFFEALERVEFGLPVGTEVSPVPAQSRVVVYCDPMSAGADRFRLAQIRLKSLQAARKLKSLLITSPLPGDGKSTVTLNLATVLAENGKVPVLLLEADVYRPTLIKRLDLKPWAGLTECYKRGNNPMLAVRRVDPLGFYLLPAGQPTEDGSCLLQSNFASQLVKGLSLGPFSWILIDSPPTTPVADILALKAQADATLLVVRTGGTPRGAVEESVRNLGRDHILGIILNGVEGLNRSYSKYYGYQRSEARAKPAKRQILEGLGLDKHAR